MPDDFIILYIVSTPNKLPFLHSREAAEDAMMNKTICPGQDTRYWKPDDVYDVECSHCGKMLEFFKDEARRKCPGCGNRIQNPKLSFGCAQWCEHAKECLGYDPKEALSDDFGKEESSLAEKLVHVLKKELGEDSPDYQNARIALKFAKKLIIDEESNPRTIIPAVLLLNINNDISPQQKQNKRGGQSLSNLERIMKSVNLDTETIDYVSEIITTYHLTDNPQTIEHKILLDSYKLAELNVDTTKDGIGQIEETTFYTNTALEIYKGF